jgi:CMP-N-acetylneuraminic acid synthetase
MFQRFEPDVLVTVTKSVRNPAFNIVKKNKAGFLELTISGDHKTRQLAPDCFDLTTVAYVSSSKFILENHKIFDGNVMAVEIPSPRGVDIDTPLDLEFARFLSNNPRFLAEGKAALVL